MLLNRFQHGAALPPAQRPTLGIQLAPPVVGAVTYLSLTSDGPDIFAQALVGYGLLQLLLIARLLPWILRQPLSAAYWAFTFGLTALATSTLQLVERGASGGAGDAGAAAARPRLGRGRAHLPAQPLAAGERSPVAEAGVTPRDARPPERLDGGRAEG
ncbi:hypothetical protein ACFSKM_17310 [Ancylobacter dichloromethanicus]